MLKIIDSVDLKELLTFGFKESDYTRDIYQFIILIDEHIEMSVLINDRDNKDRRISFYCESDLNDIDEDFMIDDICHTDIIFDLIQAGLVEKVED